MGDRVQCAACGDWVTLTANPFRAADRIVCEDCFFDRSATGEHLMTRTVEYTPSTEYVEQAAAPVMAAPDRSPRVPTKAEGTSVLGMNPGVAAMVRFRRGDEVMVSRGLETMAVLLPDANNFSELNFLFAIQLAQWDAEYFARPESLRAEIGSRMFRGFLRLVVACDSIEELQLLAGPWTRNPLEVEADADRLGAPSLFDPQQAPPVQISGAIHCPSCGGTNCRVLGVTNKNLAFVWFLVIPAWCALSALGASLGGTGGCLVVAALSGFFALRLLAKHHQDTFICVSCHRRFYVDLPM